MVGRSKKDGAIDTNNFELWAIPQACAVTKGGRHLAGHRLDVIEAGLGSALEVHQQRQAHADVNSKFQLDG